MRTLYGAPENIEPTYPVELECPALSCPPCTPNERLHAEPDGAFVPTPTESPPSTPPKGPHPPGLPASAIRAAREAVETAVAACPSGSDPYAQVSVALLHLTVATADGIGYIREAWVSPTNGVDAVVAKCLSDAARKGRFEWTGADGEITFKLPVSLEPRP